MSKEELLNVRMEIGRQIRLFRRSRKMTLEELASVVGKSKATLSKYEKGEISLDVETLYALAKGMHVRVEQLLCFDDGKPSEPEREITPAFFRGLNRFYAYLFDGRVGRLNRSVIDVFDKIGLNQYKVALYMNIRELEHYQQAENTYWGYIEHFDSLSLIELTNQDTYTEKASIQILASFLDAPTKWGLWNGVSSRPLMPVATKMLFAKKPLKEDQELLKSLKITKEDLRRLKYYNMFSVI